MLSIKCPSDQDTTKFLMTHEHDLVLCLLEVKFSQCVVVCRLWSNQRAAPDQAISYADRLSEGTMYHFNLVFGNKIYNNTHLRTTTSSTLYFELKSMKVAGQVDNTEGKTLYLVQYHEATAGVSV